MSDNNSPFIKVDGNTHINMNMIQSIKLEDHGHKFCYNITYGLTKGAWRPLGNFNVSVCTDTQAAEYKRLQELLK